MDFSRLNYSFGNLNFGFGGQTPAGKTQGGNTPQQEIFDDDDYTPAEQIVDGTAKDKTQTRKRNRARTMELTVLPERFEYRRAFSEVKMLEAMQYVKLENGVSYNFITAGDVDSLSYLKVVLNQHSLDYLLVSTWCMNAGDILQIQEWWEEGKFKKFDMHLGEIFPGSYKIEWQMIKKNSMPSIRKWAVQRCSRITAKYMQGPIMTKTSILAYKRPRISIRIRERSRAISL